MKFPNPIFTCELSLGLYPAPRRRKANAVPRRATRAPPPPANDVFFAWLQEPASGSREGARAALGGEIQSREEMVHQPDGEHGTSRGGLRAAAGRCSPPPCHRSPLSGYPASFARAEFTPMFRGRKDPSETDHRL